MDKSKKELVIEAINEVKDGWVVLIVPSMLSTKNAPARSYICVENDAVSDTTVVFVTEMLSRAKTCKTFAEANLLAQIAEREFGVTGWIKEGIEVILSPDDITYGATPTLKIMPYVEALIWCAENPDLAGKVQV